MNATVIHEAGLASTAAAMPGTRTRVLHNPTPLRSALLVIGDLFLAIGVLLCIPAVILAIGIPIALVGRLLLWLAQLM